MNIACLLPDFPGKAITFTNERTIITASDETISARTEHSTTLDNAGMGIVTVEVDATDATPYRVSIAGRVTMERIMIAADSTPTLAALLLAAGVQAEE